MARSDAGTPGTFFPSTKRMEASTHDDAKPVGLLLVGHGTRQAAGLAEFEQIAGKVRELGTEFAVESCFLEIAEPDIATGMSRLFDRGVRRVVVSPLLLFAAGHAKRDIPEAVCAALAGTSGVDVVFARPLECHPRVLTLSKRRFDEANLGPESGRTSLVLVGRGSSVPPAIEEMKRFGSFRATEDAIGESTVCFVTIARPTLDEGLALAARSELPQIVVQPHLLFAGQVADQVAAKTAEYAERFPEKQWRLAKHLGAEVEIAEASLDLAKTAIASDRRGN